MHIKIDHVRKFEPQVSKYLIKTANTSQRKRKKRLQRIAEKQHYSAN